MKDFSAADHGLTAIPQDSPTVGASGRILNECSHGRRVRLIFLGIGIMALVLGLGWAAISGFHYLQANLSTWQDRWTARKMNGMERDLPPIKNDLYGTLAGLKVVEVTPNSPAAVAGLVYGDVIVAYNKRPVSTDDEIRAVMAYAESRHQRTAELSLYRDGDMTIKTLRVPTGRLGIYTREWTFAGAFVEDAIVQRNDYAAAERYAAQAAAETGSYTADQLLHMRMLCVNNENDGEDVRMRQVDQLYKNYPADKVTLFGNYDLLYNKRYRAGAAIFERYLQLKKVDVSTELNLASCYTEINRYDEADALITKVLARPAGDDNAPSDYGLSVLSNIRGRIHMGRRQYDRAQERFLGALEHYPDDPYYALAYLYCAVRRDTKGEKPGEFELAYKTVTGRSRAVEELMAYHVDALRAFLLVKNNRRQEASALVWKWKNSADAKRYIPIFWGRFPDGADIIDNWNNLLSS